MTDSSSLGNWFAPVLNALAHIQCLVPRNDEALQKRLEGGGHTLFVDALRPQLLRLQASTRRAERSIQAIAPTDSALGLLDLADQVLAVADPILDPGISPHSAIGLWNVYVSLGDLCTKLEKLKLRPGELSAAQGHAPNTCLQIVEVQSSETTLPSPGTKPESKSPRRQTRKKRQQRGRVRPNEPEGLAGDDKAILLSLTEGSKQSQDIARDINLSTSHIKKRLADLRDWKLTRKKTRFLHELTTTGCNWAQQLQEP